jgi:DNA-binding CsgD family transcriptional regulator
VNDIVEEYFSDELIHEGVLRKSGRYPWGSGETPHQRNKMFLDHVNALRKQGLSDLEIVKGLGYTDEDGREHPFTTAQLRAARSIAKNDIKNTRISTARMLSEKGMSNVAIGERMGINESVVRDLLNPSTKAKADVLQTTANMLKDQIKRDGALDVGAQVHHLMGVSQNTLSNAIALLKEEGYDIHYQKVSQLGTNNETSLKILVPPGQTKKETYDMRLDIKPARAYSEDKGHTFEEIKPPVSIASKRLAIRYAEDGGSDMDGVIQIRRGVPDISLGKAQYAQGRILVDDSHYLKGMIMYADDLPKGVDLMFNTNKSSTGNKLDALKKVKDDAENPFGATTRQKHYVDPQDGKLKLSPVNIVNEEGDWSKWSRNLSSQMLSKQTPALAKQQLALTLATKKAEYDEIMALTNPEVKRKLLQTFSDGADSAAVQLKAAGLPRTAQHVILPIPSMKDTEIYAPKYNNGEKVVLIRHPHGGTFEIPELTVNNRNSAAQKIMKQARDAVGISPKVAAQLSGADFDGDTVLVIPNKQSGPSKVQTSKPLASLKNFDPQSAYRAYEGMPKMTPKDKQKKMGDASNLITDMTVMGAPPSEIARAVKYSMVVIDAEKHHLNHKQARIDMGISELKTRYQGGPTNGAATLISRSSSEQRVLDRKARPADQGGAIDKVTGEKKFVPTGAGFTKPATVKEYKNGKVVEVPEKFIPKQFKSSKMEETNDARTLLSRNGGTVIEKVYADHANELKALGNAARLSMINTKSIPYSDTARKVYAPQVNSLKAKLTIAQMNAPIERQAQLLANKVVTAKRQANPDMEADELKKLKGQELNKARLQLGASKARIEMTDDEWGAVQAGAITPTFLRNILDNSDLDTVKALATPRLSKGMASAQVARAKAMLASGYTQSEIAEQLGVPTSTLDSALNPKDGE